MLLNKSKEFESSYKYWMYLGCGISIYAITAWLFPFAKFNFYIFPEETIDDFNSLSKDLAVSYLMGVFVYLLTGPLRSKIKRKRKKWELYDLILRLSNINDKLLSSIGVERVELLTKENYQKNYNKEIQKELDDELTPLLHQLSCWENILTEKECDMIANIYISKSIEICDENTDDTTADTNFRRLEDLCTNITELYNNIVEEVNPQGHKLRNNLWKKASFFLFLSFGWLSTYGQELTVKSFVEKTNDLAASTYERKDDNGDPCALVKIQLATAGAQFSPNLVGNVEYKVDEYWVYLPTINKHLEVKHPNYLPFDVVFADYGIKLEPKRTYSLVLSLPETGYGSVSVAVLPDESDVYIDDKKVGTTPLFLQNVPVGKHKLEVKNIGLETLSENITVEEVQIYSIENKELIPFSFTVNGVSFDMIKVEAGTFMMGATPEMGVHNDDERPVHQVTLTNNYYLGKYEVTQALWKAVMGSNPSYYKGDNLPVEMVSWNMCQEFLDKLNRITGKNFRLPTEAEWEYAARGGKKSRGYRYSGSNSLPDVAWYAENSKGKTHHVGIKQPNELGFYDMSGNVSEWCQDRYGDYSSSAQTNPNGPENGVSRVYRGVGKLHSEGSTSERYHNSQTLDDNFLGLRLCLSE